MRHPNTTRLLILALSVIAVISLTAAPGGAGIYLNTVDEVAAIHGNGHQVSATVIIGCTRGERVRFQVTVTQDDTIGVGRGAGRCTGAAAGQRFDVTVAGTRGDTFLPGDAVVSAWAETRHGTHNHPRRTWSTTITLN